MRSGDPPLADILPAWARILEVSTLGMDPPRVTTRFPALEPSDPTLFLRLRWIRAFSTISE